MPQTDINQQPLMTLGIITHNAETTVGRAIDSALNQNWKNLEIVILDDCSRDNTLSIVQTYAGNNANIKCVQNEKNMGVAYNRDRLLDLAKGEYIAYLDDDDYCYPDRLEKQYSRIKVYEAEHGTEKILCFGDRITIAPDGKKNRVHGMGRTAQEPSGRIMLQALLMRRKSPEYSWGKLGAGTMMAKTSVLRHYGFDYDFKRAAEIDLAVRAASDGCHFISVPEPVIDQYLTESSHKTPLKKLYYQTLVLSKNFKRVRRAGMSPWVVFKYGAYVFACFISDILPHLSKGDR